MLLNSRLLALAFSLMAAGSYSVIGQPIDFESQILPILEENCSDCHGEDKVKSGFRVDRRPVMLKGGDSGLKGIVPGHPDKSFVMEVIQDPSDEDYKMPPKGDPLSTEQIALLKQWIEEGAEWPGQMDAVLDDGSGHWSYQPVVRPEAPGGASKPSQVVDAFLDQKLDQAGIIPNEPAPPETLLRRLAITLTGLPPTFEEIQSFQEHFAINPDEAYTQAVERLLASEHFGERWAQHWLDVIRWAETNGSEANLYRKNAFIYRDYLIRSFNEDKSYQDFVTEQLAGDQLGVGEATGFLVAGPHVPLATVGQEPTARRQARADRLDEMINTLSASVLGITVSCARCHNHKFDPISIQDYYSLSAVLQGVDFGGRYPELEKEHPRKVRAKELRSEIWPLRKQLAQEAQVWEEKRGGFSELRFPTIKTDRIRIHFLANNVLVDEMEVFGPQDPSKNLALAANGGQLVFDSLMGKSNGEPEKANDGKYGTNVWKGTLHKETKEKPWIEIRFPEPVEINRYNFSRNREYFLETDYLAQKKPYVFPAIQILAPQDDGSWADIASTKKAARSLEKNQSLQQVSEELHQLLEALEEEGPQHSFIGKFIKPVVTKVLLRGSPETPRDIVPPAGFEVLDGDLGMDNDTPEPERRLRYAQWLVRPEHPLTARVMVNRIWHHTFGAGIVPTGSDFGLAGAPPTHPELLDWLAAEFVVATSADGNDWSTKNLIRTLVHTEAFRRSSTPESVAMNKDAGSQLLWRFPPRRVEAEVLRDSILLSSGKLDPITGGRSFRIHNEKATYAQWEVVDNYSSETWRRMLYQERMRRVDDQIFTAFDFPDCGQVRAKRPVSTTPLQALNLMNSPFVMDQSQHLADRATAEAGSDKVAQVVRAFELLLGRIPTPDELEVTEGLELLIVCRSLINSNEFAFLP